MPYSKQGIFSRKTCIQTLIIPQRYTLKVSKENSHTVSKVPSKVYEINSHGLSKVHSKVEEINSHGLSKVHSKVYKQLLQIIRVRCSS